MDNFKVLQTSLSHKQLFHLTRCHVLGWVNFLPRSTQNYF
jgi:hypothetical protein